MAVCIKDPRGPRDHPDFPTPGDGEVDHVRLLGTLKEVDFSGPLVVERFDGMSSKKDPTAETVNLESGRAYAYLAKVASRT